MCHKRRINDIMTRRGDEMKSAIWHWAAVMALTACGTSNFQGVTKKKDAPPSPAAKCVGCNNSKTPTADSTSITSTPEVREEVFTLDTTKQVPVDVVWVIDTSASMTEEIAHVKKNFAAFITKVKGSGKVRVALIANSISTKGTSLGFAQIGFSGDEIAAFGLDSYADVSVGSTDALFLSARALCSNGGTQERSSLCGQPYRGAAEVRPSASYPPGHLASFVRPGAKTVLVVVSDDDARNVTQSNFESLLGAEGIAAPRLFGFVGTNVSTCGIANRGQSYMALATRSGGATFDICDSSWEAHFSALTHEVERLSRARITLSSEPHVIKSVDIDGQRLAPGTFSVDGKEISLALPAVTKDAVRVSVRYR
jgi:hypothetical protein